MLKICGGFATHWTVVAPLAGADRGQLVKRGLKPKAQRNPQRRAFPPPFLNMFICLI